MVRTYADIFAHRGKAYHRAMLRFPHARDAEFSGLFESGRPASGQRLLDIPSGGGYLRRHLAPAVELSSVELTAGFDDQVPVYEASRPWTFGVFDHVVCLAALHHIQDQAAFLGMLLTRLYRRGTLHLADVERNSGVDMFLDGFVGHYNVTGHDGNYLSNQAEWFAAIGRVARVGAKPCPWSFDNETQMLDFCDGLFGLVDCPREALHDALREHVGFHHELDKVVLHWRLLYVDLQPA